MLSEQISKRSANKCYTFGFQRAEVLGAFSSGIMLVGLCFSIVITAVEHFILPYRIYNEIEILILGGVGFLFGCLAYLLIFPLIKQHKHRIMPVHSESFCSITQTNSINGTVGSTGVNQRKIFKTPTHKSLNIQAIKFHLATDAFSSLLVMVTALVILLGRSDWSVIVDTALMNNLKENWFTLARNQVCNNSEIIETVNKLDTKKINQKCKKFCQNMADWTDYIDPALSLVLAGFICYGAIEHGMANFINVKN